MLSVRVFLVLIVLFLLPSIVDIVCKRNLEGGPSRFDPRYETLCRLHLCRRNLDFANTPTYSTGFLIMYYAYLIYQSMA